MFTHKKERGWLLQGILAKRASNGETGGAAPGKVADHATRRMRRGAACAAFDAPGGGAGAGQAGDIVTFAPIFMALYIATIVSAVASSVPSATIAACGQNKVCQIQKPTCLGLVSIA
jgi:hypothetical protein